MSSGYFWKWALVAFVLAWALWEINPPTGRNLIEHFDEQADRSDPELAEVADAIVGRARSLDLERPDRQYASLVEAIGTNDVAALFPRVPLEGKDDQVRSLLNVLQNESAGQIQLGLDLQGGISFLVELDTSKLSPDRVRSEVLAQAIEVLRSRIDRFGVAEPVLQAVGEDRILIQLPGLSDADYQMARSTLTRPAFLEFRMVHERSAQLLAEGAMIPGYEILELARDPGEGGPAATDSFLVKKEPEKGLTGKHLSRAMIQQDPMSAQLNIHFEMTSEGAPLFAELTRENVGRATAIVLDGKLMSVVTINEPILTGSGMIEGDYTFREATQMVNVLENPLEAPVSIVEEQTVEPTLGRDSVRSGVKACLIGLGLVAAFMAAYYLLAGMIANFALLLNLVFLLGVLCSLDATLTLPGIAGVVLTIGMAIDANVLILERIREELSKGKSVRGSIDTGYSRAFGTIFDANVTTLIASIILIYLGKGPVKGFGVTLTIGILASMFSALVITRLVLQGLLAAGWMKSVSMMRLGVLHDLDLDFMRHWKSWFAISWALILVGAGFGLYRGAAVVGIDFSGGDSMVYRFSEAVDTADLRPVVDGIDGVGSAGIVYQRDIGSGAETLKVTSPFGTGEAVSQALREQFPQAGFEVVSASKVGGSVGSEIQRSALIAIALALFGILFYVAMRYEFSFAIGAVLAVVHDVLMTLGWFFLTGRELNAPMVAAILTVIGFSINDTIVIFDRIREDLRMGARGSFRQIMNRAINKCLSRTIITSGTTLFTALSLYVFGGSVINDFAFTFMIGVITGTYSSIYIAGSIVLWWTRGERPELAEPPPESIVAGSAEQGA